MIADYKAAGDNFNDLFDELDITSPIRRKRLVQLADEHLDALNATAGDGNHAGPEDVVGVPLQVCIRRRLIDGDDDDCCDLLRQSLGGPFC